MDSDSEKYESELPEGIYYYWLNRLHKESVELPGFVKFLLIGIPVFIFVVLIYFVRHWGSVSISGIFLMIAYLFITALIMSIVDFLVLLPKLNFAGNFNEVMATPISSKEIINDLRSWMVKVNDNHCRILIIEAKIIAGLAIIGSVFGWLVLILIHSLIAYLYFLGLWRFLLQAGLVSTVLPRGPNQSGLLSLVWFLTIILVLLPVGLGILWLINSQFLVRELLIVVVFAFTAPYIAAEVLFYILPSFLEKRRQGIWQ